MVEVLSNDPKTRLLENEEYDYDDSLSDLECDLCSKSFPNVKSYEQHLKSKKHYQMLTNEKAKGNVENLAAEIGDVMIDTSNADDDSMESLSCKTCSKTFTGYIPYANHIKSNVHMKNLKKEKLKEQMKDLPEVLKNGGQSASNEDEVLGKPYARCAPCKKTFYDPNSYALHLKGSQHEKKLKNQRALDSLKTEENGSGDDELFHKCDVCQKEFSGPVPYKTHLLGSYHQRELQRSKIEEELKDFFTRDPENRRLVCKECKKGFTDALALKGHLENNNHKKQKAKDEVFGFVSSNPEIVAVKSVQNLTDDESDTENQYRHGSYFFVCKLCKSSFTGPESARDHLGSQKHIQARNEKELRRNLKAGNEAISVKEKAKSQVQNDKASGNNPSGKLETNDGFELV